MFLLIINRILILWLHLVVGVLISSHLRFSLDNVSQITERMAVKIPCIAPLTLMQL